MPALAFLLLAFATVGDADSADAVLLRHRFEADQVIRYEVVSRSEIEMSQGESSQELSHGSTSLKRYRVVEADGGAATLELSIERVRMAASDPDGGEIVYDSEQGEAPTQFAQVAATVGPPIARIRITEAGVVESVEDLGQLGTSTEQFEKSNQHTLIRLPDGRVSVGSVWKQPFAIAVRVDENLPAKKTVKLMRRYEVTAIDGDEVTIGWRSYPLTPISDPAIDAQIAHMRLAGVIVFDAGRGRVVSRTGENESQILGFDGPQSLMQKQVRVAETLQGRTN